MFVISIFGDELVKFLKAMRENPSRFQELAKEIQADKNYFDRKFRFYMLKKFAVLKKEFEWFGKADIFRQDGFYCDYQEQLKTPITVTPGDYEQAMRRLRKVRYIGTELIEACANDEDTMSVLAQLRVDFIKKGFYNHIADALALLRRTKGSPFELMKQNFSPNDTVRP